VRKDYRKGRRPRGVVRSQSESRGTAETAGGEGRSKERSQGAEIRGDHLIGSICEFSRQPAKVCEFAGFDSGGLESLSIEFGGILSVLWGRLTRGFDEVAF
jgi:hypothetical protein